MAQKGSAGHILLNREDSRRLDVHAFFVSGLMTHMQNTIFCVALPSI